MRFLHGIERRAIASEWTLNCLLVFPTKTVKISEASILEHGLARMGQVSGYRITFRSPSLDFREIHLDWVHGPLPEQ
jgi:hypothetical protein